MAFAENLAPFFSTSDFAVAALWNGATSVNVIFDRAYIGALANVVEASGPVFTCAAEDIPGVKHGDTFVIDSTTYKVVGVEPDGTGVVLIRLEAQ